MKQQNKSLILAASIGANVFFILSLAALCLLSSNSPSASLLFPQMGDDWTTAANIVSFRRGQGAVNFSAAEINLQQGETAHCQFSTSSDGAQSNWLLNLLYDDTVVTVENTAYGVLIHAAGPGETMMQMLTRDGIKNIALVRITA
jgi:hypothetical protein